MNFPINKAEISTTSGEISFKPFRKIGNVDLSANSFAIFNDFNLFSVLPLKRQTFYFFENFYKILSTVFISDRIKTYFYFIEIYYYFFIFFNLTGYKLLLMINFLKFLLKLVVIFL